MGGLANRFARFSYRPIARALSRHSGGGVKSGLAVQLSPAAMSSTRCWGSCESNKVHVETHDSGETSVADAKKEKSEKADKGTEAIKGDTQKAIKERKEMDQ